MFDLRVVTFNVRGLANPETRRKVFMLLRQWPVDVCCLQEVHAPDDASFWMQKWGRPASWTPHVAILFRAHHGGIKFDVTHSRRVLTATFRHHGRELKIVNIYAPSSVTDRRRFFDELSLQSSLSLSASDFLVGDWNAFPDPSLDRR